MTIQLDWEQLGEAVAPPASVAAGSALPEDVESLAQAQQWLQQKMRDWSDRA